MNTARARQLRNNQTKAERTLWRHLHKKQLGVKFRRQQPLGPYIVDFICFEKRLVIEIDGGQHQDRIAYDSLRTAWLEQQGFGVLRFWNNEVFNEIEGVVEKIKIALYGYHHQDHPP